MEKNKQTFSGGDSLMRVSLISMASERTMLFSMIVLAIAIVAFACWMMATGLCGGYTPMHISSTSAQRSVKQKKRKEKKEKEEKKRVSITFKETKRKRQQTRTKSRNGFH